MFTSRKTVQRIHSSGTSKSPAKRRRSAISTHRRGATLVVVLALLGLMMIIGFFAYSIAGQQQANSEYYANTPRAKARDVSYFDRDAVMDWALEQIIKGGPAALPHTALSGGRHGLVPNMFGNDLAPYSGTGYNFVIDGSGNVSFDNNYDGVSDGTLEPWMNASPAANGGTFTSYTTNFQYTPDAPYTAPDYNNVFLAHRGYGLDANNNPVLVIKPSYHRPELLREVIGGRLRLQPDWMTDSSYTSLSLRAHDFHKHEAAAYTHDRFVHPLELGSVSGISSAFPFPDFTSASESWSEGAWALSPYSSSVAYDFGEWVYDTGTDMYYRCIDPTGAPAGTATSNTTYWQEYAQPYYSYDADADGDGIKEAIWMDLDFPIQETPEGGRFFIPMFAVTIYDADALINLNAAGNLNGFADLTGATVFGDMNADNIADFLSLSNLGLSPAEINPLWTLSATEADFNTIADSNSAKADHAQFFGRSPVTSAPLEIANMEWYWANSAKLTFNSGIVEDVILGRYGNDGITNFNTVYNSRNRYNYPQPGVPFWSGSAAADDNNNTPVALSTSVVGTPLHPLDYTGIGDVMGTTGKTFSFTSLLSDRWLKYTDYPYPTYNTWDGDLGNGDDLNATTRTGNDAVLVTDALIDEPGEMEADYNVYSDKANWEFLFGTGSRNPDEPFSLAENGPLQMSASDIEFANMTSRLMQLMPYNFKENNRAESIRRNFTTHSTDIRSRNSWWSFFRSWEFWANDFGDADPSNDVLIFPPPYDTTASYDANLDPFRSAFRKWIEVNVPYDPSLTTNQYREQVVQRLMSLNHVVDELNLADFSYGVRAANSTYSIGDFVITSPYDGCIYRCVGFEDSGDSNPSNTTGNAIPDDWVVNPVTKRVLDYEVLWEQTPMTYLRRLTPHPTGVSLGTSTAQSSYTIAGNPYPANGNFGGDVALQEFWARVDRQRMARDIYVLLYMLGDDIDANPFTANPYSLDEMEDMAQFAINAVNQMDRDNIIDSFEFDTNLTNGWSLDDNPHTTVESDRGVVNGIEAQELAINEVNLLKFPLVRTDGGSGGLVNLTGTEWNDNFTHLFSYIELKNILPNFAPDYFNLDDQMDGIPFDGGWRIEVEVFDGGDINSPTGPDYVRNVYPRTMFRTDPFRIDTEVPYSGEDRDYLRTGEKVVVLGASAIDENDLPQTLEHSNARVAFDFDGSTPPTDYYSGRGSFSAATWYLAPAMLPPSAAPSGIGDPYTQTYSHLDTVAHYDGTATENQRASLIYDEAGTIQTDMVPAITSDSAVVRFRLYRRMDTKRPVPVIAMSDLSDTYNDDNPWIQVDEVEATPSSGYRVVDLNSLIGHLFEWQMSEMSPTPKYSVMSPNIEGVELQEFIYQQSAYSSERQEVLNRNSSNDFSESAPISYAVKDIAASIQMNSLSQENSTLPTGPGDTYLTWQPHYNRDFASPIDLLSIPMYSPARLTDGPALSVNLNGSLNAGLHMDGTHTAAVDYVLDPTGTGLYANPNRWYRLLAFVEVPRYDSNVDTPSLFNANNMGRYRLPGKINWNTLRSPEVLAGLMDEIRLYTLDPTQDNFVYLPDANGEIDGMNYNAQTTRDWWVQFIKSRDQLFDASGALTDVGTAGVSVEDGRDPVTEMYLPGMPGSRPFRDLSFVDDGIDSMENTMLRSLPVDKDVTPINQKRRLFEVGTNGEGLDYPAKHRLLAKVMNNSTNRSNVFFVFIQVDFFEAATQGDGSVRIGGKMTDSPGYRSMFVVDRSKAFETLDGDDFSSDPNDRFTLRFKTSDAEPEDFNWRDLVLQRLNIK
ncbi:MAG: hypothetical protein CMJ46_10635 [Planctomyces sp.]|nr:hypothetical protein [Planctomyces sp.]